MEAATMNYDPGTTKTPTTSWTRTSRPPSAPPGARGRIVAEIERLRLAHDLAAHRRGPGLSLSAAAERTGCSVEDVAALEEGDAGAAVEELAVYAAASACASSGDSSPLRPADGDPDSRQDPAPSSRG
jgi:hypothetical protein